MLCERPWLRLTLPICAAYPCPHILIWLCNKRFCHLPSAVEQSEKPEHTERGTECRQSSWHEAMERPEQLVIVLSDDGRAYMVHWNQFLSNPLATRFIKSNRHT